MNKDTERVAPTATWREHNAEIGCQVAEARTTGKTFTIAGCLALTGVGIAVFSLAVAGHIRPPLLQAAGTLCGGICICYGLVKIGRIFGQREIVWQWRDSLSEMEPPSDLPPWMVAEVDQRVAQIDSVVTQHVATAAALVATQGREDAVVRTHAELSTRDDGMVALLAAGALVRLAEHERT